MHQGYWIDYNVSRLESFCNFSDAYLGTGSKGILYETLMRAYFTKTYWLQND